ncbi:uncharacterized [Tachysurus ichikawai]
MGDLLRSWIISRFTLKQTEQSEIRAGTRGSGLRGSGMDGCRPPHISTERVVMREAQGREGGDVSAEVCEIRCFVLHKTHVFNFSALTTSFSAQRTSTLLDFSTGAIFFQDALMPRTGQGKDWDISVKYLDSAAPGGSPAADAAPGTRAVKAI